MLTNAHGVRPVCAKRAAAANATRTTSARKSSVWIQYAYMYAYEAMKNAPTLRGTTGPLYRVERSRTDSAMSRASRTAFPIAAPAPVPKTMKNGPRYTEYPYGLATPKCPSSYS